MDILGMCPVVSELLVIRNLLIGIGISAGLIVSQFAPIPLVSGIARSITSLSKQILVAIAGIVSLAITYKVLFCLA